MKNPKSRAQLARVLHTIGNHLSQWGRKHYMDVMKHGRRGDARWHSLRLHLPFKWVYWWSESVTIQLRPLEVTTAYQTREQQAGTASVFCLLNFNRSPFSFSIYNLAWAMRLPCPSPLAVSFPASCRPLAAVWWCFWERGSRREPLVSRLIKVIL